MKTRFSSSSPPSAFAARCRAGIAALALPAFGAPAQPTAAPEPTAIERQFTLPAGFTIQLVAAEPALANPMTMCVDERGTIFVTEAHTYRYGPAGSPFQPPTNPIKRIELGPDGRAARVTVVADGFPEPVIGVFAHEGKLYATCLNELFVMDIGSDGSLTNRRLLVKDAARPWNPFGMYRVAVGPDDKLWLSIADHPGSGPVSLTGSDGRTLRLRGQSGGMVRCNRDGSGLELIVQGFRAPYAFDMDPWGHLWHISNGESSPNIYVHVIPGMDYGYHSRPVSYAWLAGKEPLAPPVRDMGAGAHTSALQYFSAQLPREYWGNAFVANWGSHGANPSNRVIKRLLRQRDGRDETGTAGTGWTETEAPFLASADPRFRPTCVVLAPDGGLYVTDWHGRDDENDQTGRILKITYAGAKQPTGPGADAIARMKPAEQAALLGHPHHLARAQARRALAQAGAVALDPLGAILENGDALAAANAIWTLTRMNTSAAAETMRRALKHPDPRVRAHALRQLRQLPGRESLPALAAPLLGDADGEVRVEAALAQDSPEALGRALLTALEKATEPRLRHQIGFELGRRGDLPSLEKLRGATDPELQHVALIAADAARNESSPLAAAVSGWNLAVSGQDPGGRLVAKLQAGTARLTETSDQLHALEWLEEHPPARPMSDFLLACLRDEDWMVQAAALRATRRAALDTPAVTAATLRLLDLSRPYPMHLQALYTLGTLADAGRPEAWLRWLNHEYKPIAIVALRALRQRERPADFANALWPAAREAARGAPALSEEVRLTFRQLGIAEAELAALPAAATPPADKNQLARAVLARLKGASPALGQLSFSTTRTMCSACHSVRPGELRLGPSLAGLGASVPPQYLIESILEPSKVIKTGFQLESVGTKDGRVFSGLVESAGAGLLIRALGAPPVTVPLTEVKTRTASAISPMPAGLEAAMTVGELADLTAYLLSLKGNN